VSTGESWKNTAGGDEATSKNSKVDSRRTRAIFASTPSSARPGEISDLRVKGDHR